MIEFKDINVSFDGAQVLKDFDLSIEAGDHVCFSGASGSGKSTLLRLLQAYVVPQSGSIIIDGEKLLKENIQELRNKMIWIPQNIHLPVESGQELMELLSLSKEEDRILELMKSLGLEPSFFTKPFSELSGGQKQRVVIACCLAMHRSIILLDEPTAALDESSIQLLIQTLAQFKQHTLISTSHNATWLSSVQKVIQL
jgi:ABC-type bacteriocin/lantibiotic exporter with double-glycine peptidase domain